MKYVCKSAIKHGHRDGTVRLYAEGDVIDLEPEEARALEGRVEPAPAARQERTAKKKAESK